MPPISKSSTTTAPAGAHPRWEEGVAEGEALSRDELFDLIFASQVSSVVFTGVDWMDLTNQG